MSDQERDDFEALLECYREDPALQAEVLAEVLRLEHQAEVAASDKQRVVDAGTCRHVAGQFEVLGCVEEMTGAARCADELEGKNK